MEGNRILSVLKSGRNLDSLPKSVMGYLQPVTQFTNSKASKPTHLSKYKVFSLKVLWECIQLLQAETDSKQQEILLELTRQCCSSLQTCDEIPGQFPPHSFLSLLLDLAKVFVKIGNIDHCLESCQILHSKLSSGSPSFGNDGTSKSVKALKQVFGLLWCAASELDKKGKSKEFVLSLRQRALRSLLESGGCDVAKGLEYTMKAEQLFTQQTSPPLAPRHVAVLYPFHTTLLPHSSLPELMPPRAPSINVVPVGQYLLHRAILAVGAGHVAEGEELVQQAVSYTKQHGGGLPVAVHALAVQLWVAIRTSKPEILCVSHLEELGKQMQAHVDRFSGAPGLPELVDAMDLVISHLGASKNATPTSWRPPSECFPSLKAAVLGDVACMELFLSSQTKSSAQKARVRVHSKQLKVLSTLCHILTEMLVSSEEEIEFSRDGPKQKQMSCFQSDGNSLRGVLVDSCLPILHQSLDIINKEAEVLSRDEHRWLGNDAFQLARSLVQEGLHEKACPLVELSCQELATWCQSHPNNAFDLSLKSELIQHFLYLVECHARACDFDGAVLALSKTFNALPSEQLQSADTIKLLVERWVQLQLSKWRSTKQPIITTLLPLLKECGMPVQTVLSYLEKELSCYHGERHRHPYVLAATRDLFDLSQQCRSALSCARYSILLASECRLCGPHCQHPGLDVGKTPTQLLTHALKLLNQLVASDESHPLKSQVQIHQELATAQLRMALTTADHNISKCKELASEGGVGEQEGVGLSEEVLKCTSEMCLREVEEKLMLRRDVQSHLSKAVEAWLDMWQHAAAVHASHGPLDLQDVFHQPLHMLQHMVLTAHLCSAHSQVQSAVKVLSVVLNLFDAASEDTQPPLTIKSQALAFFAELLSVEGGVAPSVSPALEQVWDTYAREKRAKEEKVAALQSYLALANVHLLQGNLDDCRAGLLCVLDHPFLSSDSCSESLLLLTKTQLLTARYLLYRTFDLQPRDSLLLQGSPSRGKESKAFRLSPTELVLSAVKLLWSLAGHKPVWEGSGGGGREEGGEGSSHHHLSSVVLAWDILLTLLRALLMAAQLLSLLGIMNEANYYAGEGAKLARDLHLHGWYCEFLLVLYEIFLKQGEMAPIGKISSQLSRLLNCSAVIDDLGGTATVDAGSTLDNIADKMSKLDLKEIPVGEHPCLGLIEHHPASCSCQICSDPHALYLFIKLTCLASERAVFSQDNTPLPVCKKIATALQQAHDLLTRRSQDFDTDVGVLSLSGPKVKGQRRKGRVSGEVVRSAKVRVLRGEVACVHGRCLLAAREPLLSQQTLQQALEEFGNEDLDENKGHEVSIVLARLHHYVGVALGQRLEVGQGQEAWFDQCGTNPLLEDCLQEFLTSYQLCYPATPTILLRDTCLWLALLLTQHDHAHHFLALSQHMAFTNQTLHALGKKIRGVAGSKSTRYNAEEVKEVKQALVFADSAVLCNRGEELFQEPRRLLFPPSRPPSPEDTAHSLSLLPSHWTLLTLALAPKPHPSSPPYLLIATATPGKSPTSTTTTATTRGKGRSSRRKPTAKPRPIASSKVKVERTCGLELERVLTVFGGLLQEVGECTNLKSRKEWWAARRRLDRQMKACLDSLKESFFQDREIAISGHVLLVLGRHLHQLPWESQFQDTVITRTPSLTFAAAHKAMVDYQELNARSTYFVVNPHGDLEKTEKLFGEWFRGEVGWEGVVGTPPQADQLSTALKEKDLYIYCGHGVGHFLSNTLLRAIHCHAGALLIGCSSAEMIVEGQCDPSGPPLNYLLAGCPVLVGCLWSVTDGEIDRFCQSLVRGLLSSPPSTPTTTTDSSPDSTLLPMQVNMARSACKLAHLVGAAPVLYGLPLGTKC